jgi:chemotaxis protein methyltransferase CheR
MSAVRSRLSIRALEDSQTGTGPVEGSLTDLDCIAFLQWALPHLRLRWQGFRKVRGQVCKRLSRRLEALELPGVDEYRRYLEEHSQEWEYLDSLCRISISRFYRDRSVFEYLVAHAMPELAARVTTLPERRFRIWCIGCAAGEEVYTVRLLWESLQEDFPEIDFSVLGTDVDGNQIERARIACYPKSALRELPNPLRQTAFEKTNGDLCLLPQFKNRVEFRIQDIRREVPNEVFPLILCRNVAFTYFAEEEQVVVSKAIHASLSPGGLLVLGKHEQVPANAAGFRKVVLQLPIYERI